MKNRSKTGELEENIPEGLTVFTIPGGHRKRMRTMNMLERQNRELKRRSRWRDCFPMRSRC
ncbi:hypothetical protein F1728_25625 [Gimesia benthica]|uniref:Transposase n=1 Tax=Gimesia benthica TaxID=2608982 RepID=A0A6I6AGR6_9PLAN|nr:hypothetical protein F1728_25625 [Gimesia benthica]